MLDFWHTLSDCLTKLDIDVDWTQPQMLLQPQLLRQLTALTAMTFSVIGGDKADVLEGEVLDLPELRSLYVNSYWGRPLVLNCRKLTSLTMVGCDPMGLVSLQAPLKNLHAAGSGEFTIHPGFPLTNFLDLVSLSIECTYDGEDELCQMFPQMTKLKTLDMCINEGRLLQSLPQSLCAVSLMFMAGESWDGAVLPVLQQLPELTDLTIDIQTFGDALATLTSDLSKLRPFMAMQKLCSLQLGDWQAWTASSLRMLGQFEAELARSGSKLELDY